MRKSYLIAGLLVLGALGIMGWETLGTAQPNLNPNYGRNPSPPIVETVPDGLPPLPPPPDNIIPASSTTPAPPILDPQSPSDRSRLIPQQNVPPEEAPKFPTTKYVSGIGKPTTTLPDESPKFPLPDAKFGDVMGKPVAPEQNMRAEASMTSTQPSVNLEWTGPAAVKVGAPAEYTLTVRNVSAIPVQKVIVQVRVPAGATVVSTEPKAEGAENVLIWELGNMLAKQERRLSIKFMSAQRGDLTCQAWVTLTGSSVLKMHVREPKLVVKLTAPDKVVVGDPANVIMTVSNPGDHPAEHVRVAAVLGEGLESVRGNNLNFDLGMLAPGETRKLTVPCVTKMAGPQKCDAFGEADGGLKAGDSLALNVIQPRLDLAVLGPKLRYLDHKGVYTLKVTNPGDAPASNVFVTDVIPAGFKFVQADNGGQFDDASRSIKWFVGELAAGQVKEVKCELMAITAGEFVHKAMAYAARGMKAEQELKTAIEGLSAILMEVADTDDPVEVGGETTYEIKITNTGTKAETDVKLVCTIPSQMKLKSINAPVKYDVVGNDIVFQTLPRLSARADAVFKINVTAVVKGDARFKASLTTASLIEPVVKVEPTKVYAD